MNKRLERLAALPPNVRFLTEFYSKPITKEHLKSNLIEYQKQINHLSWCVDYYKGQLHQAALNYNRNRDALEELK
jgi:hypothetical protein